MNLLNIIKIFIERGRLSGSEKKTYGQILAGQQKAFSELRAYAYANSEFYKKFHKGLFDKPLNELPVLTKKMLMENFDRIVTDKSVKVRELEEFVKNMSLNDKYKNKYIVNATGGTTGLRGLFIYDKNEWVKIIASYSRANDWGGMKVNIFTRLKIAVVSSKVPWHQSSQVGNTLKSPFIKTLRIDSTETIPEIVWKLNKFRPKILVGYPSMAFALAKEQLAGRLKINPQISFCAAEILTPNIKNTVEQAWQITPFNVYAATETAGIASECTMHNGMHLYEDLVIIENVDDNYKPVAPGNFGTRLLATVLFSRTIPLIRYEITDSVKIAEKTCSCGLPFKLIDEIQGRTEDTITLEENGSKISVHPNVFHKVLEDTVAMEWQVIQTGNNAIELRFQDKISKTKKEEILQKLYAALDSFRAKPMLTLQDNTEFMRTAIGKKILIKALKR